MRRGKGRRKERGRADLETLTRLVLNYPTRSTAPSTVLNRLQLHPDARGKRRQVSEALKNYRLQHRVAPTRDQAVLTYARLIHQTSTIASL
jgi:hypothetical protein